MSTTITAPTPLEKAKSIIQFSKDNHQKFGTATIAGMSGCTLKEVEDLLNPPNVTKTPDPVDAPAKQTNEIHQADKEPKVDAPEIRITEPKLTARQQAVNSVKEWVTEDAKLELSERDTYEKMVRNLDTLELDLSFEEIQSIVAKHAPDALHEKRTELPHPLELDSLIQAGTVKRGIGTDNWYTERCAKCGQFEKECCGTVGPVTVVRDDNKTLTAFGRQLVGLDPIVPPTPPTVLEQLNTEMWWSAFSGVGDLQGTGNLNMLIENFLPEGSTLICGLPKEGKSFLALSVARALTSGQAMFGRVGFEVPKIIPVLYLAAESGDGALKLRCERMNITKDKSLFIARTLTKGPMLGLDDERIMQLVQKMRPVVVLETLIRFNEGKDEDDASENRKLAASLFQLLAWGARAVVGIHHSRKDLNKANPSKESAVRGSGDGLAMCDAVWLVMQDPKAYQKGSGPNELDVVGWGRDFNPQPMRLALTKKAPKDLPGTTITFAPGIVSYIDTKGDLEWVDRKAPQVEDSAAVDSVDAVIEKLIAGNPSISRKAIVQQTGQDEYPIKLALARLGYSKPKRGRPEDKVWRKA